MYVELQTNKILQILRKKNKKTSEKITNSALMCK